MLFGEIRNKITEHFSAQNNEVRNFDLRIIGLTFLIWGCLLYLIDSTPVGKVFYKVPGLRRFFSASYDGSLDLSVSTNEKARYVPLILSILIIFIGLILVLHSHAGLKAQATMIVCPMFYTLSFLFLIATIQQTNRTNKIICGVLFGVCLLIGAVVQGTHKDRFDMPEPVNDEEEQQS